MATLNSYFAYSDDYSEINNIYDKLSLELKKIHENGLIVSNYSSNNIEYGENGLSFNTISRPVNYEVEKRKNIVSNAKLMLGTYLSLSTGFTDFSSFPDEFFFNKIDEICSSITSDNFYPEYFYEVFKEGKNEYFCDFLARKKQERALNGASNVNSYKKVLTNAASSLYYDNEEVVDSALDPNVKQANVHSLFYPILVVSSLLLVGVVIFLINYFMN